MRNLKLTIQYDGTNYHGFQIQPVAPTIQQALENTLSAITGEAVHVNGCSRTDARVHAVKYVCSFETAFPIPADRLPIVLNNKLPNDIKALECCEVAKEFHARFDTVSKTYRYVINTGSNPDVFSRNFEWQLKRKPDTDKMKEACSLIVGTHDFKCFMTSGASVSSTVRTVHSLDVTEDGDRIYIYIRADGYLYNMVRIIVGTLVNVGIGRTAPDDVKTIIDGKSRDAAGPTAPPQGLSLFDVEY